MMSETLYHMPLMWHLSLVCYWAASILLVFSINQCYAVSLETHSPPSTAAANPIETFTSITNDSTIIGSPKMSTAISVTVDKVQSAKMKAETKSKWFLNSEGSRNQLPFTLNCSLDSMVIQVNLSSYYQHGADDPYIYLEKLKSFSICRPKIVKSLATFYLSLKDDFYRCGTTKVHDQITGSRIYYNRVVVESKRANRPEQSIYFKCSTPPFNRLLASAEANHNDEQTSSNRTKRESSSPWIDQTTGRLINFTEIDLPENFMEAEVLDFTDNITVRAPYPHLNLKVKRNGRFVNTSLNVAPGTPLEMIIYLDEESKHVYGLLASFMKVTDNSNRQQEVIVLNGCSIDPYIFGNFQTEDNGDSISAKFRAFKFPESNYVMFVGTVNVCLDQCKKVPCGNGIYGLGRRRRRSITAPPPADPNKVYEIEMMAYLRIGYSPEEMSFNHRHHESIQATFNHSLPTISKSDAVVAAKLVDETQLNNMMAQYESLKSASTQRTWHLSLFVVFLIRYYYF